MEPDKPENYQIYGRLKYTTPLEYVRTLTLTDPGSLEQAAAQLPGQHDWVELVALPEKAIIRVIPWENE